MLYAEPTMYYDEGPRNGGGGAHTMKKNMTLDFGGAHGNAGKQARFQNLLGSPDLHLLKLASPDLEKMLMQANCANHHAAAAAAAAAVATPTPTQFIYPKYQATDEQEAYARGFVEALAELQHQEKYPSSMSGGHPSAPGSDMLSGAVGQGHPASTYSTLQPMSLSIMTSAAAAHGSHAPPPLSCGGGGHPYGGGMVLGGGHAHLVQQHQQQQQQQQHQLQSRRSMSVVSTSMSEQSSSYSPSQSVKEEPQTVPNSPLMSPVNMEVQEKIKLERKRARNRIAARKCRTRKLERIARLEEKVAELKGKNSELVATAASLNEQVNALQRQISDHLKSGCQVHPVGVHNRRL